MLRNQEVRRRTARLVASFGYVLAVSGAILWTWVAVGAASASVIYQYTGQLYQAVSAPYSLSMSVNGSITLASPLGPAVNNQSFITDITSGGYCFTDGVNLYNQTNSLLEVANFTTDPSGAIAGWLLRAELTATNIAVQTSNNPCFGGECDGVIDATDTAFVAFTNTLAGTWSGPTPVPEHTTLLLTAAGLSVFGATHRRRA